MSCLNNIEDVHISIKWYSFQLGDASFGNDIM